MGGDTSSFALVEALVDEGFERFYRLLRILTVRFDQNLTPLWNSQRHHTQDAPPVGALAIRRECNLSRKLIDRLHQQRGGASVDPQLIFDLDLLDDFTHFSLIDVPMLNMDAQAAAESLVQLFNQHDGSMSPPGAPEPQGQTAFALPFVEGQGKFQERIKTIEKSAGF